MINLRLVKTGLCLLFLAGGVGLATPPGGSAGPASPCLFSKQPFIQLLRCTGHQDGSTLVLKVALDPEDPILQANPGGCPEVYLQDMAYLEPLPGVSFLPGMGELTFPAPPGLARAATFRVEVCGDLHAVVDYEPDAIGCAEVRAQGLDAACLIPNRDRLQLPEPLDLGAPAPTVQAGGGIPAPTLDAAPLSFPASWGQPYYRCPEPGCGWITWAGSGVTPHKRKHSGEKPFRCTHDGCSSAFTTAPHLRRHQVTHSKERPFSCQQPGCGYQAKTRATLLRHQEHHAGKKTFPCPHPGCDHAAAQAGNLKTHIARIHGHKRPGNAAQEPEGAKRQKQ